MLIITFSEKHLQGSKEGITFVPSLLKRGVLVSSSPKKGGEAKSPSLLLFPFQHPTFHPFHLLIHLAQAVVHIYGRNLCAC